MSEPIGGYLQKRRSWLLLPVGAYLLALPFLGIAAIAAVPLVVLHAPMGVIVWTGFQEQLGGYFGTVSNFILHGVFWGVWVAGALGRNHIPFRTLRAMWWLLVVLLVLSVSGCAVLISHSG